MNRLYRMILSALVMMTLSIPLFDGCSTRDVALTPGRLSDGRVLLPNGWKLSPAGRHLDVGDLPLNVDVSPDGHYAIVTNNGEGRQTVSVVDLKLWQTASTIPVAKSWLGIRFLGDGGRFVLSGGTDDKVYIYDFAEGKATLSDSVVLTGAAEGGKIWAGGLDVDINANRLYVTARGNDRCYVIDIGSGNVLYDLALPAKPYTCLVSVMNPSVYISLWGGAGVAVLEKKTGTISRIIPVGAHPNDMAESPDGKRLFVANGNENTVSVIDLAAGGVTETISSALYPGGAEEGSTPNSLALSPDGRRLYIANADNNFLSVMDVSVAGSARSLGFIPTGWYPACVRFVKGAGCLLVANGKGGISKANPNGPNPYVRNPRVEYIGSLFTGTLSLIAEPSPGELARYTEDVYRNTPKPASETGIPGAGNPLAPGSGTSSPIRHVFYVIKENRTYDQVFGDMPEGNGDASLCLFGEKVTPNHHALARQFVLLDNLYCDAEVSADGHNWSMGAYATDYVEKTWPTMYSGRGGVYEYEGGSPIVYPSQGYLWDNCARHGVSYRNYGEFAANGKTPGDSATGLTEALKGHVAPFYRGWDLDFSDVDRVKQWSQEFDRYEREGGLPAFEVIKLPNDHTAGTRRGTLSPKALVAQNDYALGLLVERISRSRYWKESAIFVIEDDAQNGPDHVDAHRTVALVISPYTKHGFTDHHLYSTTSMVGTMEMILGLPPLSEFDASARPLFNSFAASPDTSPYRVRDPLTDITEKNIAGAYGEEESGRMNFAAEDLAPDLRLNEIIWKSVRGAHSAMPPPVRSAFVQTREKE